MRIPHLEISINVSFTLGHQRLDATYWMISCSIEASTNLFVKNQFFDAYTPAHIHMKSIIYLASIGKSTLAVDLNSILLGTTTFS